MLKLLFTLIVLVFFQGISFGQDKRPQFEDYPVIAKFIGKATKVNLKSHPEVRKFRTMLRDAVKEGANFAGHYAAIKWDCGTICLRVGIVNLKTGEAYITPFYIGYGGVSYRLNSKLFIVSPEEETKKVLGMVFLNAL